jgi:PilZ domain-containing protein
MDRREHHRAQLSLPVRIRWNTPFGQKTEVCKTLDISRTGLLVPCQETHAPGVSLWVTFPYDSSVGDGQPEMLAKVVRVGLWRNGKGSKSTGEGWNERDVAVHFALPPHAESSGNGHAKERERRDSPRRPLALPIRVRPEHIPWFEEAMTIDVSAHGLRFVTNREYREGERLLVCFEPATLAPWPTASESLVRVVRIDGIPESAAMAVAIVRES